MNEKQNYGAEDLAGDLERFGEEIANDTERTIDETHPRNFRREDWTAMLEAIKAMREKLDTMEEIIERAATEAEEFDEETAEDRYETYWE